MTLTPLLVGVVLSAILASSQTSPASESGPAVDYSAVEDSLEEVRRSLRIPGMAAAVVHDQQLVWAGGFGYADVDNQIMADQHSPFGLASVTKPIAATLIMQLVEEGAIELDAPVSSYGVQVPGGAEVTVRHLLTHTSEGTPGTVHQYNGSRYGLLGGVIEGATGETFAVLLGERVLVPLGMMDTALNPMDSWGPRSLRGIDVIKSGLGWGKPFDHYPDVYQRLAQPYQFDDEYDLVPGMYNLYHNPGAGLISSVSDLAKFDIALDQGLLLGEEVREQMFTPAIPTVAGRSDLAYGLGWYVQEFEGTQLLWHAGRWPPSNSALYLKVPSENLSFFILANTDNLTVPFAGIGDGDLAGSTLALTFYRYFIFPRQHGYEPPSIDWTAAQSDLVDQLDAVGDEASRAFLERELWSYRQALASSGQHGQAEVLRKVGLQAYDDSTLRRDSNRTDTAGKMPFIAPIPSARTFVWFSRVVLAWLAVVVASLAWMVVRLLRTRETTTVWQWFIWLAATVFLGPLTLLVHRLARRRGEVDGLDPRRQTICASLLCITGYAVGWVLAIIVLLNLGDDPSPLAVLGSTLLIPLTVGLLWIRAPLLRREGIQPYGKAVSRGLPAELMTWSLGFAVLFPLTLYVDNRILSIIPYPTSPLFWPMMSSMSVVGLVVLMPLHHAMLRRGFSIWPSGTAQNSGSPVAVHLPTLRNSWRMMLMTVGIMVAMLVLAVNAFA